MKKKLLVFFIFFSFFLINPKPAHAEGVFDTIWTWITSNLSWLLPEDTKRYSSNEEPQTIDNSQNFTNYTNKYNSLSDRATPEAVRASRRGLLFYEILTEAKGPDGAIKYKNTTVKTDGSPGCDKDFPTTDIICYFFKNTIQKILYTRDNPNVPIEYSTVQAELNKNCSNTLPNNDNCYIKAYDNYQDIPHGEFAGQLEAAVVSSNQFNDSVGTPLAELDQGEDIPLDNNTAENVKIIAKNSDEKEQVSLLNPIPDANRKYIPCVSNDEKKNRDYLRIYHDKQIIPDTWKTILDLPESAVSIAKPELPNYDCEQKGHGRGMSQYGALGMAMSGYDYHQILNSYYGTNIPSAPNFTGITFETKKEYENTAVTVNLVGSCEDNIDCDEGKYSSCVNMANNDPTRFTLVKIKHPDDYVALKNYDCNQSANDYEKAEDKEEFNNWWDKSCTYQITLSLDDYLLGLAEIFVNWHLETHKALTVAARNIAYVKSDGFISPLKNTSAHQIFRCKTLSGNMGIPNNHNTAVAMTKNEFMTVKGQIATTEYSSIHCAVSLDWARFDGTVYEQIGAKVVGVGTAIDAYDGICYTNDNYQITTAQENGSGISITGSEINSGGVSSGLTLSSTENSGVSSEISVSSPTNSSLFYFNDPHKRPDHRINVDYDIINVNKGGWLEFYTNNKINTTDCKLDKRIFFGLNQLINAAFSQKPNITINLNNCYRSIQDQNIHWKNALLKYGSEEEAIKYVARPGQSPHHTGRAIDFGDNNGILNKNSELYQWLVQNGNKYGFYNYKPEPWHWEYNP